MSRVRKRKKLNSTQLFTFTHAAHTSLLILFTYVKPAKFTPVRTQNLRDRGTTIRLQKIYIHVPQ